MPKFKLHPQAVQYINDFSDATIFIQSRDSISIDRTLPQQRKIQLADVASVLNTKFIARDGAEIPVRIYIPVTAKKELPLIVYYHGGGWVIGDIDYMDGGCQYLTKHSEAIVISIDYRLAPENPYPIPQNDAYDGFLWAVENSLQLPIDYSKIAVAGDSAGGNLAASVTVRSIEENGPKIHKQLLIYPALDAVNIYNSHVEFGEELGLDSDEMQLYYLQYVQNKELLSHPYVSPKLYNNKALLPATMIVAAEFDVLNDEGYEYIKELEVAGVKTNHRILPGLIHSFFSKMNYFEQQTDETTALLAEFFKED